MFETESKKITRDDLKSGYIVRLKNGELRMVIRVGHFTKALISPTGEWNYLSAWDDTLKIAYNPPTMCHNEARLRAGMDIEGVYGLVNKSAAYNNALTISTKDRPLLWQRKPPKKMTVAEISRALGYPVEIVAEDTENN